MRPRDWGEMLTDELRECIATAVWQYEDDVKTAYIPKDKLTAIADRIDERHERDLRESYDCGYASADDWLVQHEDAMAEHGWVRGPLDANGEMWRCGDMSDSNWGVIEGIAYENGRWLISGHDTSAPWIPADSINHYHAPTVEDVLREFAYGLGVPVADSYVAATAAKLRLAEEVDA